MHWQIFVKRNEKRNFFIFLLFDTFKKWNILKHVWHCAYQINRNHFLWSILQKRTKKDETTVINVVFCYIMPPFESVFPFELKILFPYKSIVLMATGSHDSYIVYRMKWKNFQENGEFLWVKSQQGLILGAFFWGYLVTQLPGGQLAERFGGKHIFGWNMVVAAVATLLYPVGAHGSYIILILLRIITGLCEGVAFPCTHAMWASWAPPLERSRLVGLSYAGKLNIWYFLNKKQRYFNRFENALKENQQKDRKIFRDSWVPFDEVLEFFKIIFFSACM